MDLVHPTGFVRGRLADRGVARIAGKAALEAQQREARLALASMCIGIGQGVVPTVDEKSQIQALDGTGLPMTLVRPGHHDLRLQAARHHHA
jgi:hypothetical protein